MIRWRPGSTRLFGLLVCAALAFGAGACGSDEDSSQDDNWDFQNDIGDRDASADVSGEDAGGPDASEDAGGEDSGEEDAGDDTTTPLTAEGLSSKPWYGVSLLSAEPAATGSMLAIDFHEDMTVTVGFNEEVTGEWAFFGEGRVRLFNLMRGDEPNEPEQLLLDADVEGDHVEGLEIVIPDAGGGAPYVLRFEQLTTSYTSVETLAGNWQSDETYTGENGGSYRLVIRMLAGTFGYGVYNGAYVEFISGGVETITYDTGEIFWFSVPPQGGTPVPSLAGEVRVGPQGDYRIWAPREVSPNAGEFESVELFRVDAFTNP